MKAHGYICIACGRAVYEAFDPYRGPVCHRCEVNDAEDKLDRVAIVAGLGIMSVCLAMGLWILG